MKIGIYLGDIKKPRSYGELTFELSFVNEILNIETNHEFVFYYFGAKNIFQKKENAKFVSLSYFKRPLMTLSPFCIQGIKHPIKSLNYRLKQDNINLVLFLVPYLFEHIEIPYFAIIRDVAHRILPFFPEFSSNSVFERTDKKLNRFLTGASKIITPNEISKKDIQTIYDCIDENIITQALPCPLWVEKTKAQKSILKKNNLEKNNYIFYPAQYWAHKNHIRLILAAQIMKEQNINLKTVFCGHDKGNKPYLIKKTKELGLEEDILFLNYVNQNELRALYENAYALVYPCLAGVDSLTALEAMYFNCPVLMADHAGYNLQFNNSVLYFNSLDESDIVEKIKNLNNPATKDLLIAKGKNLLKNNSCYEFINTVLNMFDNFYLTRKCWSLKENYKNK